jgi:hypothetical protein
MATRIQVRRDTAANWRTSSTTVLAAGEIGFETDTLLFKIGDGSQTWTNLEYAGGTEPIRYNPSGTAVTDLDAADLRNNGNSKYLISGADIVANEPSTLSPLSTATDGQLLVTVAKFDYTGASGSGNERFLMTLQTLTTGRFFYRMYNGSWSSWYEAVKADPSTGNVTIAGDLAVNGGDITTTSTGTATVFNTNATTLNVGQAATTVSIGATTGTATIRNATTAISGAATVGSNLGVTGNTTLTGDLAVNGGDITTSAATATVFDTTAATVRIAGASTLACIADAVTSSQTIDIGTGATVSGATKTINIGTGGAVGSTTNINIGDADGGVTAINRNATVAGTLGVTGVTTLTGGLATQLAKSNMSSGSLVKLTVAELAVGTTTNATAVSRTISYTPALSSSTIYVFPISSARVRVFEASGYIGFGAEYSAVGPQGGLNLTSPCWLIGQSANGSSVLTHYYSITATADTGGAITTISQSGISSTSSNGANIFSVHWLNIVFSQANNSSASRTYTITGTETGTAGALIFSPSVTYIIAEVAS